MGNEALQNVKGLIFKKTNEMSGTQWMKGRVGILVFNTQHCVIEGCAVMHVYTKGTINNYNLLQSSVLDDLT